LSIQGRLSNTYAVFLNDNYVTSVYDNTHSMGPVTHTVTLPAIDAASTLTIVSGSLGEQNFNESKYRRSCRETTLKILIHVSFIRIIEENSFIDNEMKF
jgi:hypothetical protein